MGIFDALNTAVGGLQAQSFALQNISGNIANASTVGYKGIGTSFEDLIPDSTNPSRQVAGGVTAFAQATITTQGTVSASTVATNMAINGDGFFSVQAPIGTVDNAPVFSGTTDYTRRGDFQVDANGNLVNGAGYFLMGVPVDPKTGNPLGNVPQVLQFQNNFIPAQATTNLQYAANLPTTPATAAGSTAGNGNILGAGGLDPGSFAQNPLTLGTPPAPFGDGTVTGTAALNQAATPGPIGSATALSKTVIATGRAVNNQAANPITGATLLSGVAGTDSLASSFVAGDTITVNGTSITFVAAGATPGTNQVRISDSVQTLLTKIDSITGNPIATASTVGGGVISLHNGPSGGLSITSSNPGALGALGFNGTVTVAAPTATAAGSTVNNQAAAAPITGATLLSGAAGTNSLASSFVAGNTITVNGATITFVASGAAGNNQVNVTDSVQTLLTKIDSFTGATAAATPSTITGGAITLQNPSGNLSLASSNPGALAALGFGSSLVNVATATVSGSAVNNHVTPLPITGATSLSGLAGTDSLASSFAAGDSITVNGKTITFVASGAAGNNQVNVNDNVQTLLTKIDALTGATTPSTISGGVVTLHSGAGGGLSITSSNPGALGALGFNGTFTVPAAANALASSFSPGDVITVDGTSITFVAAGATPGPNQIRVTDTVGSLLSMIDSITGTTNPSTINPSTGAITLHTGTAGNLSVSSTSPAFAALGFATTMTAARTGGGTAGTGFVIGNDLTSFTNETISGGAVTAFNSAGTPINLQLRWAKTDSASLGSPHQDTWNLFYQTDPSATGSQVAWVNVGTNFTFNSNGSLSSPAGSAITIPGVTVSGQSLGNLTLNLGAGGLTQFASSGGTATINNISQNGFAAGQLQSIAINNNGLVVGTFSNGQNIDLAAVTLSHFNGTNYLKALDGGAYAVTDQSGPAIAGASGTISGSSLEGSNTDIADEFTKLIVTQQAYSANTKVITTANDMVQSLLGVIR